MFSHQEDQDSPRITDSANSTVVARYVVKNSSDTIPTNAELRDYVRTISPLTNLGLPRLSSATVPAGWQRWRVTVTYGTDNDGGGSALNGGSSSSFETGGGSQHIKFSRSTRASYKEPNQADQANFCGAINVSGQTVGGTDISVPVYTFTETRTFSAALVNDSYKNTLYQATAKTNDAPISFFGIGEVLFLGATGQENGNEIAVTGSFAASPTISGLSVGEISGIYKQGWDFLWVYFDEDVKNNFLIKKPIFAFVEEVYESYNLQSTGLLS